MIRRFAYVLLSLLWLSLAFTMPASAAAGEADQALTARLRTAFHQVEGLRNVTLEVRGGVAVLRGEVPTLADRNQAAELARQVEGVLAVDNGIAIQESLSGQLAPAWEKLQQRLHTIFIHLPLLGVALLVVLVFWLLSRLIASRDALYRLASPNLFVQDVLKQVTSFAVFTVGVIVALEVLNATALVGAVLGTAGLLGVVVGFAFKDLAENSLASILLSLRQPFAPNDHVVVAGKEGKVVRLNSRATILLTLDGNHLRIPNSTVFKSEILNYTRNPERRFEFTVGVSPAVKLEVATSLARQVVSNAPGVLSEPAPQVLVDGLGDWTVNIKILAWVDQTRAEFLKVKSETVRLVKEAFDQHGVDMPEQTFRLLQPAPQTEAPPQTPVDIPIEAGDVELERHLDQRIQDERIQESDNDLLTDEARLE